MKPTLKLVHCHRGDFAKAWIRTFKRSPEWFERIPRGPLKGCLRRVKGRNVRSVYKLGRGFVLEFVVCIRVRP